MGKLAGEDWRREWFRRAAKSRTKPEAIWSTLKSGLKGLEPKLVVEWGCRDGWLTRKLRSRFPEARVVGVDVVAPEADDEVEFRTSVDGIDGVDLLVTAHALQHLTCPEAWDRFSRESVRMLRPGGRLLILEDSIRPGNLRMTGRGGRDYEADLRGFDWEVIRGVKVGGVGDPHTLAWGSRASPMRVAITCMNRPYTRKTIDQVLGQVQLMPVPPEVVAFDGEGNDDYLKDIAGLQSVSDRRRNVVENSRRAFAWLAGAEIGLFLQDDLELAPGFFRAVEALSEGVRRGDRVLSYWYPYSAPRLEPLQSFEREWRQFYGCLAMQARGVSFADALDGAKDWRRDKAWDLAMKQGFRRRAPKVSFVFPSLVKHQGMVSSINPNRCHKHHVAKSYTPMTVRQVEDAIRARPL